MLPCRATIVTVPSWRRYRQGRNLCGGPLARPRQRLPCYYLPLHGEVRERESHGQQTHDDKHIDSGSPSLPAQHFFPWTQQPNIQLAWPWVRSQQNGIKSHPPQNIIMACKMRRAKEDVCCISCGKYRLHVWPGFIRFLAEAMTHNSFTSLFGSSHLKTGLTLVS